MITNYKKTKEDVLKAYSDILAILPRVEAMKSSEKTPYDETKLSLEKKVKNVKQNTFLLMIAGEAKSGKSTFINAYLGEEILPMDVKQCTSAIVEIRYGEKFILTATYADGRVEAIADEQEIKKFLAANAALDENYRDIPVSTINIGLLMRKHGEKIYEAEIKDLLKHIEKENIHKLPSEEYERKVRQYIEEKQPMWGSIVKKIEIQYPFADADLKNIKIVDTPGVNAAGRVGDITEEYIKNANAVMFLKPLTGQALESTSFRNFLDSESTGRNTSALFWILTRRADLNEADISRLLDEAARQCPAIDPKRIISVDSKAQMFYNKAKKLTVEELNDYVSKLENEKRLDNFAGMAWYKACKDRDKFLGNLEELSNFGAMGEALNQFAHKAHYILLSDCLNDMQGIMEKAIDGLEEKIKLYRATGGDPEKLGEEVERIKGELEVITGKIHRTVEEVASKYSETGSTIDKKADAVIREYETEIDGIDPENSASLDELEKISFRKIDLFTQFETDLQRDIVAECDEALISLGDKGVIKYSTLKPSLTKEIFDKIKNDIKNSDAAQAKGYTDGKCLKKPKEYSYFSQKKFFGAVRDDIKRRIANIKGQAVADLKQFVTETTTAYKNELTRNKEIKISEFNGLVQQKKTAEEVQATVKCMEDLLAQLRPMSERINGLKGGIESYV